MQTQAILWFQSIVNCALYNACSLYLSSMSLHLKISALSPRLPRARLNQDVI